jgi:hypothetical protein
MYSMFSEPGGFHNVCRHFVTEQWSQDLQKLQYVQCILKLTVILPALISCHCIALEEHTRTYFTIKLEKRDDENWCEKA